MKVLFLMIDVLYILIFYFYLWIPFLWESIPFELAVYFSLFLFSTLVINLMYVFYFAKFVRFLRFKNFIMNFLILCIVITLLYSGIRFLNFNFIKEFNYIYAGYGGLFVSIFYFFTVFLILSSQRINEKREQKIFRKLAIGEYEKEKLYQFVKVFQPPFFSLYQYMNLLDFVNSYVIERKDQFLASINFIFLENFCIIFDFYVEDRQDIESVFRMIEKEFLQNISYLLIFRSNSNIAHICKGLNYRHSYDKWIQGKEWKDIEQLLEKHFFNAKKYILKNFYKELLEQIRNHSQQKENIFIVRNITLQNT